MSLRFVAIVDAKTGLRSSSNRKDYSQNALVFFRSALDGAETAEAKSVALSHQFVARMALDFLPPPEEAHKPVLLIVHDGMAVYGIILNTKVIIMVGASSQQDPRTLLGSIRQAVDAYIAYLQNPFRPQSPLIESKLFRRRIDALFPPQPSAVGDGLNTGVNSTPTPAARNVESEQNSPVTEQEKASETANVATAATTSGATEDTSEVDNIDQPHTIASVSAELKLSETESLA